MADEKAVIITGMPTAPDPSPGAAALRAEVDEIMRQPDYAKRSDLQEKVMGLYRQHYGDAKVPVGGGITVEGAPGGTDAPAGAAQGTQGAWTPEQRQQEEARVLGQLRQEWGGEYDANFASAQAGAQHLVETVFGGSWERFREVAANFGDDAEGMKVLARLGRQT